MKNCFFLFAFLSFIVSGILFAELPEPYASIHVLPEYDFGYYSNAKQIQDIFDKEDIQVVIEVGSWIGGGSTKHMGNMLRKKHGKLYAVDTWLGSSTQQPSQIHYQECLEYVYQQFLSNMILWDLAETVIPCRMRSTEAAQCLNVKPDLIYIDAEHTTEAVYQDLTAWYPFVSESGILCGDDWSWPSVKSGVMQFAKNKGLKIQASGNFWVLNK